MPTTSRPLDNAPNFSNRTVKGLHGGPSDGKDDRVDGMDGKMGKERRRGMEII
jgi:hypothetical protein